MTDPKLDPVDPKVLIAEIRMEVENTIHIQFPYKRVDIETNINQLEAWVDRQKPKECTFSFTDHSFEGSWQCSSCNTYWGRNTNRENKYCPRCGSKIVAWTNAITYSKRKG